MNTAEATKKYMEEMGGIFSERDIDAIPYNHWKKDCEWIVCVFQHPYPPLFIPISALTAKEACTRAIREYIYLLREDDDEYFEE